MIYAPKGIFITKQTINVIGRVLSHTYNPENVFQKQEKNPTNIFPGDILGNHMTAKSDVVSGRGRENPPSIQRKGIF